MRRDATAERGCNTTATTEVQRSLLSVSISPAKGLLMALRPKMVSALCVLILLSFVTVAFEPHQTPVQILAAQETAGNEASVVAEMSDDVKRSIDATANVRRRLTVYRGWLHHWKLAEHEHSLVLLEAASFTEVLTKIASECGVEVVYHDEAAVDVTVNLDKEGDLKLHRVSATLIEELCSQAEVSWHIGPRGIYIDTPEGRSIDSAVTIDYLASDWAYEESPLPATDKGQKAAVYMIWEAKRFLGESFPTHGSIEIVGSQKVRVRAWPDEHLLLFRLWDVSRQ